MEPECDSAEMSFHANLPWLKPSAFTEDALPLSQESPTGERLQCLLNSSISFYLPISYHRSSAFNGNFDNNKKDAATKNYFDKRAEEFMDRINQLIVAILGENTKQAGLNFEGQRNLLWIQYILPCFVSSLMSARKIQRFKSDNLNKLVEFINNFISQFEEDLTTPVAKGSTNYDVNKSGDHIEILDILWQEVKFERKRQNRPYPT
ncbi:Hypothetical predicted protein [Cloeon dipterum]|uniref:Uncharacterized protein n=1 Tax=Cloeon dipterum TaxID=197152 RepID=A0A8S1CCR3_9INSE|nr:Hypothetical predicted protein [Cloeon dipterum]